MPTNTEYLRKRVSPVLPRPSWVELTRTEWSREFERLMRNRLVMGALRYQTFAEKRLGHDYDIVSSMIERLEAYQKDGNLEHMVDVANLAMIEFEAPSNSKATWKAVDDGIHVRTK